MKDRLKTTGKELKLFFKIFLPKGKTEIYIFAGLLVFYLSYSLYLIFNTYIIDHPILDTDLYFSFDNPLVLKHGRTQISGHPLMYLFFYPMIFVGNMIAMIAGMKMKTLFMVILSASMISMSCVYINRYLREITEAGKTISLILTLFYAFFSTNLVLSFTPESFTLSAFFLSFSVYYYSLYIKNKISPPYLTSILIADVFLGGVTITNFVKGLIPVIFLNEKKTSILKRLIVISLIFGGVLLSIHVVCLVFLDKDYFRSIFVHREAFTPGIYNSLWYAQTMFSRFFGNPVFITELVNISYYNEAYDYHGNRISEMDYHLWWQYLFSGLLLLLLIVSLIRNYKNKLVQFVGLLFLFDIGIHCVLRFGLFDPYIYGAHWVYCLPLILGWLYKSFSGKMAKGFTILMTCMLIALIINNLIRLSEFLDLAVEIFPIA